MADGHDTARHVLGSRQPPVRVALFRELDDFSWPGINLWKSVQSNRSNCATFNYVAPPETAHENLVRLRFAGWNRTAEWLRAKPSLVLARPRASRGLRRQKVRFQVKLTRLPVFSAYDVSMNPRTGPSKVLEP